MGDLGAALVTYRRLGKLDGEDVRFAALRAIWQALAKTRGKKGDQAGGVVVDNVDDLRELVDACLKEATSSDAPSLAASFLAFARPAQWDFHTVIACGDSSSFQNLLLPHGGSDIVGADGDTAFGFDEDERGCLCIVGTTAASTSQLAAMNASRALLKVLGGFYVVGCATFGLDPSSCTLMVHVRKGDASRTRGELPAVSWDSYDLVQISGRFHDAFTGTTLHAPRSPSGDEDASGDDFPSGGPLRLALAPFLLPECANTAANGSAKGSSEPPDFARQLRDVLALFALAETTPFAAERVLHYASLLETLLLDGAARDDVTSRLKEAVAHSLGRTHTERRELRETIQRLYKARSEYVHTTIDPPDPFIAHDAAVIARRILHRELASFCDSLET